MYDVSVSENPDARNEKGECHSIEDRMFNGDFARGAAFQTPNFMLLPPRLA